MPIKTQCRRCGKKYRVRDELAGKKIPCKECGAKIRGKDPYAAPPARNTTGYADVAYEEDAYSGTVTTGGRDPYSSGPPRRKRKKKRRKRTAQPARASRRAWWRLPVGILGMLLFIAIGGSAVIGVMEGKNRALRGLFGSIGAVIFFFQIAFGADDDGDE
ncbi:MAG: zinc-ribbon domain-containing protein [Planctomycetaceae bacterium]|nr:zinc-ribbon domain-containing protein [Planctomycetaceae bacterium]